MDGSIQKRRLMAQLMAEFHYLWGRPSVVSIPYNWLRRLSDTRSWENNSSLQIIVEILHNHIIHLNIYIKCMHRILYLFWGLGREYFNLRIICCITGYCNAPGVSGINAISGKNPRKWNYSLLIVSILQTYAIFHIRSSMGIAVVIDFLSF